MGFWDSVGSFVSGCVSAVSSCVSSVCSFVSSTCSAIGGVIGSAIGGLATAISPYIGAVAQVVMAVAQILGLFKPEQKVKDMEDLGYTMTMVDEKPEDFDSIEAYIAHLREEIRSGRVDVNAPRSAIESAGYLAMGTALTIKGIDEKLGLQTDAEFWKTAANKFEENKINEEELDGFLEQASQKDIDMSDFGHYLEMKPLENGTNRSEISSMMIETIKDKNPHLSEDQVYERFNAMLSPEEIKINERYWQGVAEKTEAEKLSIEGTKSKDTATKEE